VNIPVNGSNRQQFRSAVLWRRWLWAGLCGLLLVMSVARGGLYAQTGAPGPVENTTGTEEDSSKRVDESEESYRARMELRDQRFREQKRADMIYSNQAWTSKLDRLPEESQEHIKKQLREMIIASRQWKPGEDVSDYPYEPSAAARTDAQLRNQEREAWAEQLEKYQQREAAAYADSQGGQDGSEGGQEPSGQRSNDGNDSNTGAAGQERRHAAHDPGYNEVAAQAAEDISTEGVSENALSFLQGKSGQPAGSTQQNEGEEPLESQAPEQTGGLSEAEIPPGSMAVGDLAQLQGMNTSPGEASVPPSAQSPAESPMPSETQPSSDARQQDGPPAGEGQAADIPDSLLIEELAGLNTVSAGNSSAAVTGSPPADETNAATTPDVQAGTLEIDELKRLKGN